MLEQLRRWIRAAGSRGATSGATPAEPPRAAPAGSRLRPRKPLDEAFRALSRRQVRRLRHVVTGVGVGSVLLAAWSEHPTPLLVAGLCLWLYLWLGRCPRCLAFREAPDRAKCTRCGALL